MEPVVAVAAIPAGVQSASSDGVRTLPRVELSGAGALSAGLAPAQGQRGWLRGFVAQAAANTHANANLKVVLPSTAQVTNEARTRV